MNWYIHEPISGYSVRKLIPQMFFYGRSTSNAAPLPSNPSSTWPNGTRHEKKLLTNNVTFRKVVVTTTKDEQTLLSSPHTNHRLFRKSCEKWKSKKQPNFQVKAWFLQGHTQICSKSVIFTMRALDCCFNGSTSRSEKVVISLPTNPRCWFLYHSTDLFLMPCPLFFS